MNLQQQRISELCESLGLAGLATDYDALAQDAVKNESSYSEYLEQCLKVEQQSRQQRTRSVML